MQRIMDENLTLNEIQPLMVIDDYSLTYALVLLTLIVLSSVIGVYFLYKYFSALQEKKKKLGNTYYLIQNIDLSDTRKASYCLSIEGFKLLKTPQQKKIYEAMNLLLREYKYTEDTKSVFDKKTLEQINKFLRVVK